MINYKPVYIDLNTSERFYLDKALGSAAQFELLQDVASDNWLIVHNQHSNQFVITIFKDNHQIVPDHVNILSNDSIQITFSTPIGGKALIYFF